MSGRKKKVAYFYDSEVGGMYYGPNHPMKPHRMSMAYELALAYELHKKMQIFSPRRCSAIEMAQFHSEDYVDFLSHVTPDNQEELAGQLKKYNLGEDCPVFDGLWDFCKLYTGASIQGAARLNQGHSDIAINYAGGLHHGKKSEASGFCYINDLVLAILELLKYHARVLYIDIDIHHGDGVEEAFYTTDRVMTLSFHKYGDYFFPGTGDLKDIGESNGKYYSLNVPLRDGIDDESFQNLYKPILAKVMEIYQPGAVVLQCGADSLAHDRLGSFNLTLEGHGECLRFLKKFDVPILVTGGGGYTKKNVARCWAYETSIAVSTEIGNEIPDNLYHEYYAPDYNLHIQPWTTLENINTQADLEQTKRKIFQYLSAIDHAPSVQMHKLPPETYIPQFDDDVDLDTRFSQEERDLVTEHDAELYEGDYDQIGD